MGAPWMPSRLIESRATGAPPVAASVVLAADAAVLAAGPDASGLSEGSACGDGAGRATVRAASGAYAGRRLERSAAEPTTTAVSPVATSNSGARFTS